MLHKLPGKSRLHPLSRREFVRPIQVKLELAPQRDGSIVSEGIKEDLKCELMRITIFGI